MIGSRGEEVKMLQENNLNNLRDTGEQNAEVYDQ